MQYLFIFISFWQFAYNVSNSAINALIRFLKFFVYFLGVSFKSDAIASAADRIPLGLKKVHKSLGVNNDFIQYVVCSKCHSIYKYEDCIEVKYNKCNESKRCRHIAYPNHSQVSHRKQCDTFLLKKVRSKNGYSL